MVDVADVADLESLSVQPFKAKLGNEILLFWGRGATVEFFHYRWAMDSSHVDSVGRV